MEDWLVLRDGTLSHSDEDEEEEVTIACSTDPSDRVIALSSSSDASSSTDQGSSDDDQMDDDGDDYDDDDDDDDDDRMMDEELYDQSVFVDSPKHKHEEEERRINQIAHLVLPCLPAKSLLRFKSVSPNFNHLISSPFMVLSHFLHANTLSGLFYRAQWNKTCYLSFDAPSTDLPDPALSYLPEPVLIKASTHGMLCVRGLESLRFYITNPTTMEWVKIPDSNDYDDNVAVVVVFDEPSVYNFSGDYRVVFVYPVDGVELGGVYTFRTFSSDKWAWIQSQEVCEVENIVAESGIGVDSMAYWRTSHETLVRYDPVKDRSHIMQRPHATMNEVWWELGEMEGKLSVTSQSNEDEIMISTAVANKGEDDLNWKVMGNFWLSRNTNATAIRSQGSEQLVLWEEKTYVRGAVPGVVLRDMQGQEVHSFAEPKEYTTFVPYISTLVPVKGPAAGTSTEHLVKSSGMPVQGAIGKIVGEEASKSKEE